MNFNQWFESQNKCHKSLYGGQSILEKTKWEMGGAWEACKQEVLKILNRRNNGNINDLPEDRVKEIENL